MNAITASGVLEPCGEGQGAFGDAFASDGKRVLVGAPFLNDTSSVGPFACVGIVQGESIRWEGTLAPPPSELRWGFMFASSVFLSGNTAVIGNPGGDSGDGKVHVFERKQDKWTLAQSLGSPQPLSHEASTNYGVAVALHQDTLYVGNPLGRGDASESGVVHVFGKTAKGFVHVGDATTGDAGTSALGSSLAVAGRRLAVAARDGVHLFDITAPKTPRRTSRLSSVDGQALPAQDDPALAMSDGLIALAHREAGVVHVFRERDGEFEHCRSVRAPSDAPAAFGNALALAGGHLVIGASGRQGRGGAYVTRQPCESAAPLWLLTPAPGPVSDEFGLAVGSAGGMLLVGAPASRRVHVFSPPGSEP